MYISIILGTGREGRQSEKVSDYILQEIAKNNIQGEIVDVRDYRLDATDATGLSEKANKYREIISKSDALIIVSPEYNHGYPGELKMLLDMLYKEYAHKPVGFCGVSAGGLGGARVVEQLRLVCIEFHMIPIREALYFSTVQNMFDESGKIKDDSFSKKVLIFLEELISFKL